jgi:hypothetical protein
MTGYTDFSDNSRVWIYQSKRLLTQTEEAALRTRLQQFAQSWVSHNRQLKAFADVFHHRFVVLMVDESQAGASGCSIDASVAFLRSQEQILDTDFFDRLHFTIRQNGENVNLSRDEFAAAYAEGKITDDTLVFDNLVQTKKDFDEGWLKPVGKSWLKRMV